MRIIQLTPDQLQQISTHAERTYPEECCGLLIGQIDRTYNSEHNSASYLTKTVLEVWPVPNAWSSEIATDLDTNLDTDRATVIPIAAPLCLRLDKTDRYWIDPREMLKVQRYARDHQLNIIGIYHSHPDHPAVPSECDRSLAWAQYSYLITSVHRGKAQATHCWSLDDEHQFQPEAIVTL